YDQGPIKKRLVMAIPLFAVGFGLTRIDFNIVWRYFAWSNQTLAMIALWAGAAYLVKHGKNHWIASAPATFMTAVSITYLAQAPEGFRLPTTIAYPIGLIAAIGAIAFFLMKTNSKKTIEV